MDVQCYAPIESGRCINPALGTSKHCELHRPRARQLYYRYYCPNKELGKIDICAVLQARKPQDILKVLSLAQRIRKSRLEHQTYAIHPECSDRGHTYQLHRLDKLTTRCELILQELHRPPEVIISPDDSSEDDEEWVSEDYSRLPEIDMPDDVDKLLDRYIAETQDHVNQNIVLLRLMENQVSRLWSRIAVNFPEALEHVTYTKLVIFNIITMLSVLCQECYGITGMDQTRHGVFVKQLLPPREEEYCVLSAYDSSDNIKAAYKSLIVNTEDLPNVLGDFLAACILHKRSMLHRKCWLRYDPDRNGLRLFFNMNDNMCMVKCAINKIGVYRC